MPFFEICSNCASFTSFRTADELGVDRSVISGEFLFFILNQSLFANVKNLDCVLLHLNFVFLCISLFS